jgi:hypothetical protein
MEFRLEGNNTKGVKMSFLYGYYIHLGEAR